MVNVTFEIDGRHVVPEDFDDELERDLLTKLAHATAERLASTVCAEHDQTPEVHVSGRDVHHLTFEVRGCCPRLVDRAMNKLR